ncbi:hypothetical protein [Curtobacterium flaccumfaciens]|uniref:hypothetical protein n=1 Tax=Curtobacterium flaccumfaciens TaxID=2035 RepID=UPI001BDFD252|nr:hypothetical protein [Curtobacterium flaccumfaciens]MBT1586149.1 hypothetical protein [Curtobacterium flaccumfaciens pv. flaccumfaciens]
MLTQDEILKLKQYADTYRSYSKPTDIQKLIVALNDIENKTDDDISKIRMCLKAERKAEKLHEEKEAIRKLIREEKDAERKKLEHEKFSLGGWVWSELKKGNQQFLQAFNNAVQKGDIKATYKDGSPMYKDFIKSSQASPAPQNNPASSAPAVGGGFGFRE